MSTPRRHGRIGNDQLRQLVALAQAQGFTVRRKGSGHLSVYAPGGEFAAQVSSGNLDYRAIRNIRSALRRHGLADRPQR